VKPEEAQLITTDLKHFIEAFDALSAESDSLEVLNRLYFTKATPGMKEYINRHQLTAEMLLKAIKTSPDRYEKMGEFYAGLESFKAQFIEAMKKFDAKVPDVMFAPTYLIVGANRGLAQASFQGQLVTVTRLLDRPELLTAVIVHELAHFQQAKTQGGQQYVALYSAPNNMLGLCLREGGAEFFTDLVLGTTTTQKSVDYLMENEQELKERFVTDLKKQDTGFWLWESLNKKGQPKLLGYSMGFHICKAYYNKASDKEEALRQILAMEQPVSFMKNSGYFEGME
jgi:hypothetical protein